MNNKRSNRFNRNNNNQERTKAPRRINNIVIEDVDNNNLDDVVINVGKHTGKSLKWIYENDAQYIKWISEHSKKQEYKRLIEYSKKREFIKTEEIKHPETKTIEETYINPIIAEDIKNGDYSRFVTDRTEEKEYNGDVYKVRLFLNNMEVDINNERTMEYITRGIINETNVVLSQHKSDFSVIKLFLSRNGDIKTIKLKRKDILNNNFNAVYGELMEVVYGFIDHYNGEEGTDTITEQGFRLSEITYATVYQKRTGGCNYNTKDMKCYETIANLHNLIGYEDYEGCEFSYNVLNYKSKNNNCGLVCIIKALNLKANEVKPDSIRKKYGIPLNTFINCEKLGDIANLEFQCNLIIVNLSGFILFNSNTEYDKNIILLLEDNHYKHVSVENIKIKKSCELCGLSIFFDDDKHICNIKRLEYYQSQILKKTKFLMVNDNRYIKESKDENSQYSKQLTSSRKDEIEYIEYQDKKGKIRKLMKILKTDYDHDLLYFDFETVQIKYYFDVYAVGCINEGQYIEFYGENALSEFVEYLIKNVKNKKLVAYNGCRFDFIILLKELMKHEQIEIKNYLKNGSRLLTYEFNGNSIIDLYNFTQSSLKKACDDFGLDKDKCKTEFDHTKINTWDDVHEHREEVLKYLEKDVVSMKELYKIFNDMIYEILEVNITEYLTLPALAFDTWTRYINDRNKKIRKDNLKIKNGDIVGKAEDEILIEIPDKEKYEFVRKCVYGGRVTCNKLEFINKEYQQNFNNILNDLNLSHSDYIELKDVEYIKNDKGEIVEEDKEAITKNYIDREISKNMNYENVKNSNDYIFNGDVSSLYPTAMRGNELLEVKYPVGCSRWSNDPKNEFENKKLGFYEINYKAAKLFHPILPSRKRNGGIQWTCENGHGFYTNIEIEEAIMMGYEVEFINKCLVYDKGTNNIYNEYIEKWYSLKNAEDKKPKEEKNNVLREICKLFMNALYGKMLQKSYFESQKLVQNTKEIYEFGRDHYISDIELLGNGKILLSGTTKEEDENEQINKPSQFGAFVLSYSRRLMNIYNKMIDPELKSLTITYGDTDSCHVFGNDHKKLMEIGVIQNKLGYLANDVKDGDGIIIMEKNLGSKLYMYKYLNNKNEIKTIMKSKGLPKKYLQQRFYLEEKGEVTIESSFKKVFTKINSKEKNNNIDMFTIRKEDIMRTFNKTLYSGRELRENGLFYPIGFFN
jgi:hypothetical protein